MQTGIGMVIAALAFGCGAPQQQRERESVEVSSAIAFEQDVAADSLRIVASGTMSSTGSAAWTFTVTNESDEPIAIIWTESSIATAYGSVSYLRSLADPEPAAADVEIGPGQTRAFETSTATPPHGSRLTLVFSDGASRRTWSGLQRGGLPGAASSMPAYSPGYSSGGGGCVKGCRCGNSCIDCSKTCRGGSTYRKRRR